MLIKTIDVLVLNLHNDDECGCILNTDDNPHEVSVDVLEIINHNAGEM